MINCKKSRARAAIALGIASVSLFAACSVSQPTQFSPRWLKVVNEITDGANLGGKETTEYTVSFEKGANTSYSVDYSNGKFRTELYADENKNYVYETSLTIDVSYSFGNDSIAFAGENGDVVKSKAVFKNTKNGLAPVSSSKTVIAHVPASASSVSLEGCYHAFYYTISTDYSSNSCTVTYYKDKAALDAGQAQSERKNTFEHDGKHSLIDNEELLPALRAINESTTFSVYNTAAGKMQNVSVSKSSKEKTAFKFKIEGADEEAADHTLDYATYSVKIDDVNPGATQEVQIAATADDLQNNEYRNVILKMKTPLSFNLGTLVYSLSSVNFLKD